MTTPVAILFPNFRVRAVKFNLSAATISPGQTASGTFPLAMFAGGGLWTATLTDINIVTEDEVRVFRAVRMAAEGGATPLLVPRRGELKLAPWPNFGAGSVTSYGDIPFSDGALFSDGSGFYQPVISVRTVTAAALRDTTLTLQIVVGSPFRGGEVFSIVHAIEGERMYEITNVTLDVSGNSVVTIRPPLRDDVPAGASLNFDLPRCTMRLAKPDAMDLDLSTFPYPKQTVSFVETFFNT